MSLVPLGDARSMARRKAREMARVEREVERASEAAMRAFLRRVLSSVTPDALTAASGPLNIFTLGEAEGWWQAAMDEHLVASVTSAFTSGFRGTSDLGATTRSAEATAGYIARVTDRLSGTAQPGVAAGAFDKARTALAQEIGRGSGVPEIAERLAAEFGWNESVGFWRERADEATDALNRVLDPIGPPGDEARKAARLGDPEVRRLQEMRTEAVKHLDRDRSEWATRAERIARTESTGAYNAGSQEALIEEGVAVKVWVATLDDRTREDHAAAMGQCVPVTDAFDIGGEALTMPGDPSAPPAQIVNCRCTIVGSRTCDTDIAAEVRSLVDG